LYYRLSVFSIHLPPLRERGEDLPQLVQHFLRRFNRELGREVQDVAPEALERLRSYSWPGNVRELQSVLKQALLQARGTTLLPNFLPALSAEPSELGTAPPAAALDPNLEAFVSLCLASAEGDLYAETHLRLDRRLLTRVLEDAGGSQNQAARRLGIARDTLRRRLVELGLHLPRRSETGEDNPD
jgi:two-component system nitrogen regulation response regulator GlnG